MSGQDGGFRAAAARFSAEVESALTRARRAASEAKAQSTGFRKDTRELAEQARTGRLRGVRRDQVEPTGAEARAEAAKFRHANGLADELDVADLPDAGTLIAGVPPAGAAEPAPEPDDEDFSQHAVMVDVDEWEEAEPDDLADTEPAETGAPEPADTSPDGDDEDFSQQRILLDPTVESYRPEVLPDSVFDLPGEQNRS